MSNKRFYLRMYFDLEVETDEGDGSQEYVDLAQQAFFYGAEDREIPAFLDRIDRGSEGLDLPK